VLNYLGVKSLRQTIKRTLNMANYESEEDTDQRAEIPRKRQKRFKFKTLAEKIAEVRSCITSPIINHIQVAILNVKTISNRTLCQPLAYSTAKEHLGNSTHVSQ
jgi:hypothetical protein